LANINKTIFVIGGTSYIGFHDCKVLFKSGYSPVTFGNLIYGHKETVKWG